ncbi:hypothetical protein [Herbaspirillum sp. NPDC101396]|uniref:hypothetical protein n=1 Tax=Herbaspirillum sp. NPDC101396 TaxID=3364005 RepID=UPI00383B5DE8
MSSLQTSTRPVLLAVLEYGEMPELLRVAESARAAFDAPVIFMFVKRSYRRLVEDTSRVVDSGFLWMDSEGNLHEKAAAVTSAVSSIEAGETPPPAEVRLPRVPEGRNFFAKLRIPLALAFFSFQSIFSACRSSLRSVGRDVVNVLRDRKRFRARHAQLASILAKVQPRLLIVGQDSPGNELSFLLIAAGRQKIPRLITPFAMFSIYETAEYALAQPSYQVDASAMNRVVATVFPHWSLHYRGRQILRLPGYRAMALELTGLIKGMPWSPLSEPAEAITANAAVAADALIDLGHASQNLHVIGSPIQDRLASHVQNKELIRERLFLEHGLTPGRPLLVCGWPVNMFSWLGSKRIAYPDYQSVARAWTTILSEVRTRYGINILISVHPKTLQEEMAAAQEAKLPCTYANADELVAVCDLFTTLNGSSITAWAIACGVPVVLFDCFLTRYPDFLDVAGCITVETEEEFSGQLNRLCGDDEARRDLARLQASESTAWGVLDGKAGARLNELLIKLTDRNDR